MENKFLNNNAVAGSLLILVMLGVFFSGAQMGELFTGRITETEKGILNVITDPVGADISAKYSSFGNLVTQASKRNVPPIDRNAAKPFPQGLTTPIVKSLEPGVYTLTIKKPGYKDFVKQVGVYGRRTETLRVQMEPLGRVKSVASLKDVKVSFYSGTKIVSSYVVNARFEDQATERPLPSGEYTVVFEKKGYKTLKQKVKVLDSGVTNVYGRLELAFTCNDKVQNQGEAGVDCGGPCINECK